MEKNSFEGFFPFIIIILVYLVSNLRNRMKKQQEQEVQVQRRPETVYTPPPAIKVTRMKPPPPEAPKLESLEPPKQELFLGRYHSKRDLIIAHEILSRRGGDLP